MKRFIIILTLLIVIAIAGMVYISMSPVNISQQTVQKDVSSSVQNESRN